MPWKERTKMEERLLLITRYEQGESITDLCREYGVSRKTAYKFLNRYRSSGARGLEDLRRRPYTNPKQTRQLIVDLIVDFKREKPHWGSSKIKEVLTRRHPNVIIPARSTIHLILERYGLIEKRRQNRLFLKAKPTDLQPSNTSNDLMKVSEGVRTSISFWYRRAAPPSLVKIAVPFPKAPLLISSTPSS